MSKSIPLPGLDAPSAEPVPYDPEREQPLEGDELQAALRRLARRPGPNHLRATALREAGLTARELEVLHLLAEGHQQHANRERLFVAERTLAKHIEHILAKLPARSRAEAVAIA